MTIDYSVSQPVQKRAFSQEVHKTGEVPTLEMVMKYGNELRSNVDPEKFFTYYDKNKWTIAGEKIEDWRALFKAWDKRELKNRQPEARAAGKKKQQLATMDDPEFAGYVKWFTNGGYKIIKEGVNGKQVL